MTMDHRRIYLGEMAIYDPDNAQMSTNLSLNENQYKYKQHITVLALTCTEGRALGGDGPLVLPHSPGFPQGHL